MSKEETYKPFEGLKQMAEMWEKQLNGLLFMLTDNEEFVRTANLGLNVHSRYMEWLKKNQELLAGIMNMPTKNDIANIAKLSVQAEGKIDLLEEQIWTLEDNVDFLKKEGLEMTSELVKTVKQINSEIQKSAIELNNITEIKSTFQEFRQAVAEIRIMQVNMKELQKEFEAMKEEQTKLLNLKTGEAGITREDMLEIKQGVAGFADIKKELASMKKLLDKPKSKEKELVQS